MKQPLVIGYKGEIGSFILNGLLRIMPKASDIWCVDVNNTDDEVKQRIKVSDVIFLCIPLQITIEWLLKHKILLKDKIIIEQCSLKEWIYKDDRISDLNIKSMHILFRPSQTPNLKDRKVALFLNQVDKQTVKDIANITQSEIIWFKDAKIHDKFMAVQQALVHRTLLILGKMLMQYSGSSTYVSSKVIELRDRILKGNVDLYNIIQGNEHLPEIVEQFKKDFDEFDIKKYW